MARQAPKKRPAAAKPIAAKPKAAKPKAKPAAKEPVVVKRPAAVKRPAKATPLKEDRAKPKGSWAIVPVPKQVTLGDMITILSGVHKMKVGLLLGITPCYFKLKLGKQEVRVKKEHARAVKECAEEALKAVVSSFLPPKRRINGKQRNPEGVAAALCELSPLSRKRMLEDEEEREVKRRAVEEKKKEEEEARRLVEEEAMRKADEEAKREEARRKEEEAAAAERQKASFLQLEELQNLIENSSDEAALEVLRSRDVALLKTQDWNGQLLTFYAAKLGHLRVLDFLLGTVKLDANHVDTHFGQTALHYAGSSNQEDAVRMLKLYGADPEIRDKRGWRAVTWATENSVYRAFHGKPRQTEEEVEEEQLLAFTRFLVAACKKKQYQDYVRDDPEARRHSLGHCVTSIGETITADGQFPRTLINRLKAQWHHKEIRENCERIFDLFD